MFQIFLNYHKTQLQWIVIAAITFVPDEGKH